MTTDARKIIAGSLIAVLALSILSIVTPAYSEQPTDNQGKDKKRADEKAKAKQHVEEQKAKAKQHVNEGKAKAKERAAEQEQQATSSVNGTATTSGNSTAKEDATVDKPHRDSTFTLVGSGEASKRDGNDTAKVSAEFKLSVFRATPHMVLLKVTGGSITIGDAKHAVEQGKAVMAMKAHKMILTAQVADEHGKKILKLMGSADDSAPETTHNADLNSHAMELHGKLAQWFIKMNVVTKSG